MQNPVPKVIYAKQIATSIFWGGMYVAGRVVAEHMPAFSAGTLRFLFAGLLLFILWFRSPHNTLPKGKEWISLVFLALSGTFLYNFLFFNGMQTVSAARAAVIVTTNPIFTALLARIFYKEALPPIKIAGITIASLGVLVVITRGAPLTIFDSALSHGDIILFCAALSWSVYSMSNKLVCGLSAVTTITFTCIFGFLMITPFAIHEGLLSHIGEYPWQAWAAILYISVCCTVMSFVWFNQGIIYLGAQRASLFINLVPVFTVFMGAALLGEPVTPAILGGVFIVCVGVFLANRRA